MLICLHIYKSIHQAVHHHRRVHMVPFNPPGTLQPAFFLVGSTRAYMCSVRGGAGYRYRDPNQLQRHQARASHPLQLLTTFMNGAVSPGKVVCSPIVLRNIYYIYFM